MKIRTSKPVLIFLLFIGIVIIGFSAIFMKLADAPGNVSAFYRLFIGSVFVFIPFLFKTKKSNPKLSRQSVLISILGGVVFGIDMVLWATGVEIGGTTNPTLMANTAPIWVGLGAVIFLKEKLKAGFWFGLVVAFSGVFLVLAQNSGKPVGFNTGSILGLAAAVFYGSFLLISQYARRTTGTLQYFWISSFAASVTILIAILIFNQPLLGYSFNSWIYFFLMGIVVQVFGWLILNYLQGHLSASLISPTLLLQPVLTALLAFFFLGETFNLIDIFGGLTVLLGIFIVHKTRNRNVSIHHEGTEDTELHKNLL